MDIFIFTTFNPLPISKGENHSLMFAPYQGLTVSMPGVDTQL